MKIIENHLKILNNSSIYIQAEDLMFYSFIEKFSFRLHMSVIAPQLQFRTRQVLPLCNDERYFL